MKEIILGTKKNTFDEPHFKITTTVRRGKFIRELYFDIYTDDEDVAMKLLEEWIDSFLTPYGFRKIERKEERICK